MAQYTVDGMIRRAIEKCEIAGRQTDPTKALAELHQGLIVLIGAVDALAQATNSLSAVYDPEDR